MAWAMVSVREVFGIDVDMECPAFSIADERVPDTDDSYVFDPDTTLAILAGFAFNRRVMVQGYHGTGKSTHIEQVAARLNWPCVRVNLDGHVSRLDLVGKDAVVLREGQQVTEFQEGIVLCQMGSNENAVSRCQGPLQTISSVIRDLGDAYTRAQIGMACGSDRNLRDLGMVSGMRAFGCGFGIHPDPAMASLASLVSPASSVRSGEPSWRSSNRRVPPHMAMRCSRSASALPISPSRVFSATTFLASLIAREAASLPSASM